MKQTNKLCRLAPLCHLPRNKPFRFMRFLKSRGEKQLEFHKTARGLGLPSQLHWVPSYLSATAGCQRELFQAPLYSRMHPRLMFGGIFCGWQWVCAGEGGSWAAMDAQSEPWNRREGQGGWGKDLTWRGKRSVQEWSRSITLQLLLFSFSLIIFFHCSPCLSWFFTPCLLTSYSHVFFTFSVFSSGSGALIWEVELVCHGVNW